MYCECLEGYASFGPYLGDTAEPEDHKIWTK